MVHVRPHGITLGTLQSAVELRLGEKRAGQLENLIGSAQLLDLALQGLHVRTFLCAQAFAYPGVNLLLLDPVVKRLRHAADLGSNRFNAGPQGGVLAAVFLHHPNGAFANLG